MKPNNAITILLADDDQYVLDDISTLIDWEGIGCPIIGKARNGKQALSMFRKHRPNVVITDIVMPLMDGIELIQETKRLAPETYYVILSSYDDFAYAKSALRLGVTDYLLKAEISAPSLENMMLRLSAQIKTNIRKKRIHDSLNLSNHFRFHPVDDSPNDPLVEQHKHSYYLFFLSSVPYLLREKFKTASLPVFTREFTVKFVESLGLSDRDFSFEAQNCFITGIYCTSNHSSEVIKLWLNRIDQFYLSMGFDCRILYTPFPITLVALKRKCFKFKNVIDYALFFSQNRFEDIYKLFNTTNLDTPIQIPNVENFKKIISNDGKKITQEWAKEIEKNKDYESFRQLFYNCCNIFHKTPEDEIVSITTSHAFYSWIGSGFDKLSPNADDKIDRCSFHIRNAVLYMNLHYMEPTLSIEEIAESCGISGGRLSVLFKKELSMTINEYLTSVRVKHAVTLLTTSNYKVYEIANRVGYASSQYFSQIFYSRTGRKPLEYRKSSLRQITYNGESR